MSPLEREFGVPIPGQILEPARWTRTGLKRLPPSGPMDWVALFGRRAPLVLDIGCGNGRFLLGSALARPDHDHLGIDILPLVLRYATRRANQRGVSNIRFAAIDGQAFLDRYVAPGTLAEIHCYHPQPYYDLRQVERRLLTPAFLVLMHQSLVPGGLFFVQTDNPGYWQYIKSVAPVFFEFSEQRGPWPDAPKGRTRREIIARRRRLQVFRGWGKARTGLGLGEAQRLAQALPPPVFSADRKLRQLDALERE